MKILEIKGLPYAHGKVLIEAVVEGDKASIYQEIKKASEYPYSLELKPIFEDKSGKQLKAIWGKIGELAEALGTSKQEVYTEMVKRYGQMDVEELETMDAEVLEKLKAKYYIVQAQKSKDGYIAYCYRGIADYDSKEAKHFLDGILEECGDCGLSKEIRR